MSAFERKHVFLQVAEAADVTGYRSRRVIINWFDSWSVLFGLGDQEILLFFLYYKPCASIWIRRQERLERIFDASLLEIGYWKLPDSRLVQGLIRLASRVHKRILRTRLKWGLLLFFIRLPVPNWNCSIFFGYPIHKRAPVAIIIARSFSFYLATGYYSFSPLVVNFSSNLFKRYSIFKAI